MKRKYVPDLTRQQCACEANYLRLLKLLPDLDSCDSREFHVDWHRQHALVRIQVEERFTYTTTVRVTHELEVPPWLQAPSLLVRLYHDARMAEVICCDRRRQLRGRYGYPNDRMRQPDEKEQLNAYLAEWLNHCLRHGHSAQAVAIA